MKNYCIRIIIIILLILSSGCGQRASNLTGPSADEIKTAQTWRDTTGGIQNDDRDCVILSAC